MNELARYHSDNNNKLYFQHVKLIKNISELVELLKTLII